MQEAVKMGDDESNQYIEQLTQMKTENQGEWALELRKSVVGCRFVAIARAQRPRLKLKIESNNF